MGGVSVWEECVCVRSECVGGGGCVGGVSVWEECVCVRSECVGGREE